MPKKPLRRPYRENGLTYIPLTRGFRALVDRDVAEEAAQWNWFARTKGHGSRNTYAVRTDYSGEKTATIQLHTLVLPPKEGFVVDHINGDTLDNRRCNLRYATLSQNMINRRMPRRRPGARGTYQTLSGRWAAAIAKDGRRCHLGVFDTLDEARSAYNEAALRLHGEFALLS